MITIFWGKKSEGKKNIEMIIIPKKKKMKIDNLSPFL